MGLPQRFRVQRAKIKRTQEKLQNAESEFRRRELGYKDEGISFSSNIQQRLLNSMNHWRQLRAKQSAELLRLHARMLQNGDTVDPAFDPREFEKFAKG